MPWDEASGDQLWGGGGEWEWWREKLKGNVAVTEASQIPRSSETGMGPQNCPRLRPVPTTLNIPFCPSSASDNHQIWPAHGDGGLL